MSVGGGGGEERRRGGKKGSQGREVYSKRELEGEEGRMNNTLSSYVRNLAELTPLAQMKIKKLQGSSKVRKSTGEESQGKKNRR